MNLREMRKEKNMTQTQLALFAGVTQTYIGALENGKRKNPSAIVLKGIAKALEVSVESVLEAIGEAV